MAKVITLSQTFPAYHPMKGKPTHFVEKVWCSLTDSGIISIFDPIVISGQQEYDSGKDDVKSIMEYLPKHHTIRAGKRWKAGDIASLRVWSGRPYNSNQIIIAPDIKIARTIDFEMDLNGIYSLNGKYNLPVDDWRLAENDGLTDIEMFHWFMKDYNKPKEFSGQVIIWNDANLPY